MNDISISLNCSMNAQQLSLYHRIQAFEIDEPDACFLFAQRLARDSQWSIPYTYQVIEEYKKFLFLAISTDHPVVPSHIVDEAWHLHLTYTHSYWDNLCGQILKMPLHHHPSQVSSNQQEFFKEYYEKTLRSYEHFFGYAPPLQIWQSVKIQFGQFNRINNQGYWLILKPYLNRYFHLSLRTFTKFWLKLIIILSLVFRLTFSLYFLFHPVVEGGWDTSHFSLNQPAFAQTAVQNNASSLPRAKSVEFPWWLVVMGCIWLLQIIYSIMDSRCPGCRRFGMKTTQTVVLQPTSQYDGKEAIMKRCSTCHYKEVKTKKIHYDNGCTCV